MYINELKSNRPIRICRFDDSFFFLVQKQLLGMKAKIEIIKLIFMQKFCLFWEWKKCVFSSLITRMQLHKRAHKMCVIFHCLAVHENESNFFFVHCFWAALAEKEFAWSRRRRKKTYFIIYFFREIAILSVNGIEWNKIENYEFQQTLGFIRWVCAWVISSREKMMRNTKIINTKRNQKQQRNE